MAGTKGLSHLAILASVLAWSALAASPCVAQDKKLPPRETSRPLPSVSEDLVMSKDGRLAAPWVERKLCKFGTQDCVTAIVNTRTKEIARVGDEWASAYAPTQSGKERRRLRAAPGASAAAEVKK